MKLPAILFTLSIFCTVLLSSLAHAGGRDGGNGPVYKRCSDSAYDDQQARNRQKDGDFHSSGERCIPESSDMGATSLELGDTYNDYN